MKRPNFVIVGFPKCGTTSLHYYLDNHPEIFMPKQKELHYFTAKILTSQNKGPGDNIVNQFHINSFQAYKQHFKKAQKKHKAIGDASPSYINYPETIPDIKEKLGADIKIIIVLRDPIRRAFSNYLHLVRENREKLSFFEALKAEEQRMKMGYSDFWYYKWNSLYAKKIEIFKKAFDEVYVMTNENLKQNPLESIQNLYKFLGVDATYKPQNLSKQYNPGGLYKQNLVTKLIFRQSGFRRFLKRYMPITPQMKSMKQGILKQFEKPKPEIDKQSEDFLVEYFKDDVKLLKSLIGLNIESWHPKLK
ncbi:MAG: sulfotransferase [Psychroflexus sp.]|nr:sulfotransferase [Psychroflexus sp.]